MTKSLNTSKIQIVLFYFLSLGILVVGLLNVGLTLGAGIYLNPILIVIALVGLAGQVFYGYLIYSELKNKSIPVEFKSK